MFTQLVALIEKADDAQSPAPVPPLPSDTAIVTVASGDETPCALREQLNESPVEATSNDSGVHGVTDAEPVMPSPIPATANSMLDIAEGHELHALARAHAHTMAECDALQRKVMMLEAMLEDARVSSEAKDQLLMRVARAGAPEAAVDDETRCEAKSLVTDERDAAIAYLQRALDHSVKSIGDMSNQLETYRASRTVVDHNAAKLRDDAAAYQRQLEHFTAELEDARTQAAASKKENVRLSQRSEALRAAIDSAEAESMQLRRDLSATTSQILKRDNEVAFLRQQLAAQTTGTAARDLRSEPLMAAMSKNKVGVKVVSAVNTVDTILLRFGWLLRANSNLRLIAALYVLVLHVYVFNAVMVFLHHSTAMPDHAGHDVHDHIANHVHH